MKAVKRTVIVLVISIIGSWVHAQDSIPKIEVLAKASKNDIKLRWAPNSPVAWQRLNTYGFIVERSTIIRDGMLLNDVEKKVLTPLPIKPRPLNDWESIVDENDYAAVAAQAIYGETFELSENYSNDIIQVIQKSKELEQRFSFALFSADQSFEVAELSALAFIDNTAKEGEKYSYKIKSAVPNDIEEIDFGTVYIGLEDYEPLPKIYDLQAVFGDKSVILSWERLNFEGIYNSFIIEKSLNTPDNFKPISKEPIINASSSEKIQTRRSYKIDSLSKNGQRVYYRVKGINAFGEISPPSDSVFGEGFIRLSGRPEITKWTTDNVKAEIQWDFGNKVGLEGFKVGRSSNVDGPYMTLDIVGNETSKYVDDEPMGTNYYRITAFNANQDIHSFPVMVQLEDSIPPAIPTGLKGTIDSTGVVSIEWNENIESDLLGYRVYRTNFKSAEAIQITKNAVKDNSFRDTISIDNLTGKIYYNVQAVDKRFNPSEKSILLELKKPDIVPPVPPVFNNVKTQIDGSYLQWIPSSSTDVVRYDIYKKTKNESNWELIGSLGSDKDNFLDSLVQTGQNNYYTIVAVDHSGNESIPAKPVQLVTRKKVIGEFSNLAIKLNQQEKSIEISWDYNGPSVSKYIIYRSKGDDRLSLYRSIDGSSVSFFDDSTKKGSDYVYLIKSELDNGQGVFSSKMKISY
ncbi:MAG: hypothetical protein ABJH05_12465 [Fulvivirga sp.]